MFLPIEFENRMKDLLGEEYEAFAKAFCEGDEAKGLRFSLCRLAAARESFGNDEKEQLDKTIELLFQGLVDKKIPWSAEGYYICSTNHNSDGNSNEGSNDVAGRREIRPGKNLYHEAGAYYLQEPSAMVVATLAGVKPGEKVLDLCAAPGGKSTALGDMLCGEGVLVSNEIHPARVKILSENIERMGIPNALVLNETPEKVAQLFPEFFDCVVVDAPCSGEGMFRKEEAALREWSLENVEMCAARQKEILREAVKCVAPGGRLVYSTCTFAPAEDEENIKWLLYEYPEFSLREIPTELRELKSNGCIRIWPHKQRGEGHFAALLERTGEREIAEKHASKYPRSKNIALSREQRESFESFAKETLTEEGRK